MFKKKKSMLLTGAVLMALAGMSTANADCLTDITASVNSNAATSEAVLACGVQLTADPARLADLIQLIAQNAGYSAAVARALYENNSAIGAEGANVFQVLFNSPALSDVRKKALAQVAANIIVANAGDATHPLFTAGVPTNDTIKALLIALMAINPDANVGVTGDVVFDYVNLQAIKDLIEAAANAILLSQGIGGTTNTILPDLFALDTTNPLAPSISKSGLGQVLIFPYYTTRGGKKSIINVFNTSGRTVAAKVRFRESQNSRDVLDFTVVLSPYDKWSGSVRDDNDGTGPYFSTNDSTCTAPEFNKPATISTPATDRVPLSDRAFNNFYPNVEDTGSQDLERLKEGYIEVIAMGDATEALLNSATAGIGKNAGLLYPNANNTGHTTTLSGYNTAYYAKHVNGTPRSCSTVATAFNSMTGAALPGMTGSTGTTGSPRAVNEFRPLLPGNNPLRGALTIIDKDDGVGFGTNAVAIANFNNSANLVSAQTPPFFHEPTIASRNGLWTTSGLGKIESLLLAKTVINEWADNGLNGAATDWVIQFPTKALHVDVPYADNATKTGCYDKNFQAARNIYRGNLDCNVTGASGLAAVAAAQARVDTATADLTVKAAKKAATVAALSATPTAAQLADDAIAGTNLSNAAAELNLANQALAAAQVAAAGAEGLKYSGNLGSFESRFIDGTEGSPISIGYDVIDKEESAYFYTTNTQGGGNSVIFSPGGQQASTTIKTELNWESNVISFSNNDFGYGSVTESAVLSSKNPYNLDTIYGPIKETNGMALIHFAGAKAKMTGLPVIGFVAKHRTQGSADLHFGQMMDHSYK